MSRALSALIFGLTLLFGVGCADRTPCETALQCVILCQCSNGGDGFGSGYRCVSGSCVDGHIKDRDCERICQNVIPPVGVPNDDDSSGAGDDDSAETGDDDSGAAR